MCTYIHTLYKMKRKVSYFTTACVPVFLFFFFLFSCTECLEQWFSLIPLLSLMLSKLVLSSQSWDSPMGSHIRICMTILISFRSRLTGRETLYFNFSLPVSILWSPWAKERPLGWRRPWHPVPNIHDTCFGYPRLVGSIPCTCPGGFSLLSSLTPHLMPAAFWVSPWSCL